MLPACAEKACLLLSLIVYTITQVSGLTGLKKFSSSYLSGGKDEQNDNLPLEKFGNF